MEDFASGDGGSDLISLVAYLRDCSQGEAARELAEKLGVALYKGKGASSPKANGYASHVAPEVKAGCCGLSPREGRAWRSPNANSSSSAFASFKSRVSNPSVNQP